MKETRFNIGMNTLKQIDGLHGEEVYNTIQEISPAIADLLVELFGDIYTHCIPYAGFPRVLNALFTVKAVFEERNVL